MSPSQCDWNQNARCDILYLTYIVKGCEIMWECKGKMEIIAGRVLFSYESLRESPAWHSWSYVYGSPANFLLFSACSAQEANCKFISNFSIKEVYIINYVFYSWEAIVRVIFIFFSNLKYVSVSLNWAEQNRRYKIVLEVSEKLKSPIGILILQLCYFATHINISSDILVIIYYLIFWRSVMCQKLCQRC